MEFVADANVLIDFAKVDRDVLALVARHLGALPVARDTVDEVGDLREEEYADLGIGILEPTAEQLAEAGAMRPRGMSFPDRVCFIVARDRGATCLTNEKPLGRRCAEAGVPTMRSLRLLLCLVEGGHLGADAAVEIVRGVVAAGSRLKQPPVPRIQISCMGPGRGPRSSRPQRALRRVHNSLHFRRPRAGIDKRSR